MPLDVVRLAQSDLIATEDPAAIVANLLLWCASWHSVPAASLTDDDRSLARLAGYGRGVAEFSAIKAGALRGWIKCSDGRLYHPVVAEKAREAFRGKLAQRHRTFLAAVRKHNERDRESGSRDQRRPLSYEEWLDAGRPTSAVKDAPKAPDQPLLDLDSSHVTRDGDDMSRVTDANVTHDGGGMSRQCHAEKRSKGEGEGEGQGQGQGDSYLNNNRETPAALRKREIDPFDVMTVTDDLARRAGVPHTQPTHVARNMDQVRQWHGDGIAMSVVEGEIDRFRLDNADKRIATLAFFDAGVRAKLSAQAAKARAKDKPMTSTIAAPPIKPLKGGDMVDERIVRIRSQVGTAGNLAVDKAKLGIEEDRLVVIARSSFVAAQLREDAWNALTTAARGANLVDVEVRVQ